MSLALSQQTRAQVTDFTKADKKQQQWRPGPAAIPAHAVIQRKAGQCACGGDCPTCQAAEPEAPPVVQHKAAGSFAQTASPSFMNLGKSTGSPMPREITERAESVLGADLSAVRFHNDGDAHNSAAQLQAKAFTTGHDVYFGAGWYQPSSEAGLQLIGHELTHVVQQRRGLSPSRISGVGDEYEVEADRAGEAFARGESAHVASTSGSSQGVQHAAVQRASDPGADAARVADNDDSPYGFPFLGMANNYAELAALMNEMSTLEGGAQLGLVDENFAMGGGGAPAASQPVAQAPPAEDAPVQASLLAHPIQRAVVAGCNVPSAPANVIGMAAHMQIGGTCARVAPTCLGGGHPGFQIPGGGRPDMVRQHIPAIDEVGEIKPASWLARGLQSVAAAQLAGDLASYIAIIGPAVPMWSYTFPSSPFALNPSQRLRAWSSGGIYYYSCTGGARRRVRVRVRIPVPIPVVPPVTVPSPRPIPVPVTPPVSPPVTPPVTVPPSTGPGAREVIGGAAAVGAGIGIGYLIYRGVRMIPSLFPPAWPTIPLNLAIP
jgi:Domain of unknown function (DUF4157)/Toxin with a conserved tryptophan and TIP tripeptide motif